ncbi:hypothetical protein L6452_39311 [Arctium lappa]|uniref:Uncharacterized protein n=1 Tax=Arctium lappa TaxID=4217 RepID=A0ACB8XRX4_ARCLA|nr:hypothetical protein L6452_39311 [Arctium lappa]
MTVLVQRLKSWWLLASFADGFAICNIEQQVCVQFMSKSMAVVVLCGWYLLDSSCRLSLGAVRKSQVFGSVCVDAVWCCYAWSFVASSFLGCGSEFAVVLFVCFLAVLSEDLLVSGSWADIVKKKFQNI